MMLMTNLMRVSLSLRHSRSRSPFNRPLIGDVAPYPHSRHSFDGIWMEIHMPMHYGWENKFCKAYLER
jgi:hypothetical protein